MLRSKKLVSNREELHSGDVRFMHVFSNPDGKFVLEDLIKNFFPEKLSTGDEYNTCKRAHQSDVIRYIQRRIEDGVDGKSIR